MIDVRTLKNSPHALKLLTNPLTLLIITGYSFSTGIRADNHLCLSWKQKTNAAIKTKANT